MAGRVLFILCASIITAVLGGTMQGATLSFRAVENNAYGWLVDFKYKSSFIDDDYNVFFNWGWCYHGYCLNHWDLGFYVKPVENSTAYPNPWYQFEGYFKRQLTDDKTSIFVENNCCWVFYIYHGLWLSTKVDLGVRSDKMKPNASPVTTIIPIIRIPQNCESTITLLAHDPDGDQVTCGYGYEFYECSMCSWYFPLDKKRCTISVPYGRGIGLYAMELFLEDYPQEDIYLTYNDGTVSYKKTYYYRKNQEAPEKSEKYWYWGYTTEGPTTEPTTDIPTTEPTTDIPTTEPTTDIPIMWTSLSRIPLQFLIEVTNSAPSCTFGDYRPAFLPPTPNHGQRLLANVKQIFQLQLTAQAVYDSIEDFKVSGPPGMIRSLSDFSHTMSMVVEWTPEEANEGEHVPVCFVAETYGGYQSELRCVIIIVGPHSLNNSELICNEDSMTLIIPKPDEGQFRLIDPNCLVGSNSTHLIADVNYNSCGTVIEETEEDIVFSNVILSIETATGVITRESEGSIPFNCTFPKKNQVMAFFQAHKSEYIYSERGFGTFTYKFQFFRDEMFTEVNMQYPLEVALRDLLYMEIQVSSSVPNVQLFVESCKATPHDNPNDPIFYNIIENGCIKDNTVVVYPGSRTTYRFGMKAFAFIGYHPEVYISCTVILCKNEANTRCRQGCMRSSEASNRHKRSLESETQQHFISQGPVRLKSGTPTAHNQEVKNNPSEKSNTLVITLSGMATVALVAVVLNIYMTRARDAGYKMLHSQEC